MQIEKGFKFVSQISCGDEDPSCALSYGMATLEQKEVIFVDLKRDETLPLNEKPFKEDCYELWLDQHLIGLCSLGYRGLIEFREFEGVDSFDDGYVSVNLELVYLLEEYRGKGLGGELSTMLFYQVQNILLNDIFTNRHLIEKKLDVSVSADFESKEGQMFFDCFYNLLSHDFSFVANRLKFDFDVSFECDAGY